MIILLVCFWQMTTAHDIISIDNSAGASGQQYLYPLAIDFSLQLVGSSTNFSPRPILGGRGHKVALLLLNINKTNLYFYIKYYFFFSQTYFRTNKTIFSTVSVTLVILVSGNVIALVKWKLDRVGPIDNRPSNNKLCHLFEKRKKKCDMWHVIHDLTCWVGWTFSQNFISLALTVSDLWYYEDSEEKAIHEAVCLRQRT